MMKSTITGGSGGAGRSRLRGWLGFCLALAVGGCAGGGVTAEGVWLGRLHTVAGTCPTTEDSDLRVSGREVLFVPGDGVLTLRGLRGADPDAFRAQVQGGTVDRKTFTAVFEGRLVMGANGAPDTITGVYGTPECRATIAFHRPRDVGLRRVLGG